LAMHVGFTGVAAVAIACYAAAALLSRTLPGAAGEGHSASR